jgi:hypothetical protein
VHRSGWQYVIDNLYYRHHMDSTIVFDGYVDKTFGWNRAFYVKMGKLPIKKRWVGVMHHTFSTYSENNLEAFIEDPIFLESLETCVCLVVLSKYLQRQIYMRMMKFMTFDKIPNICVMKHPTETPIIKFNYKKFKSNPMVTQIGAWLRDTYAIYKLQTHIKKYVLVGKHMENYYVTKEQLKKMTDKLHKDLCGPTATSMDVVLEHECNKFVRGMIQDINDEYHSVTVLQSLDNLEYDNLLASSVVFVKLVDASAVNTVIECITRNTPICVNRIPAVVEYLGKDYPLFYDTIEEAGDILTNKNIKAASKYLASMDKKDLMVEYFCAQFDQIITTCMQDRRKSITM